jgi:hypothetical protein
VGAQVFHETIPPNRNDERRQRRRVRILVARQVRYLLGIAINDINYIDKYLLLIAVCFEKD